ncbi:TIGR04255 family protein [Pseudoalteromonas piscicida]|uniref:TIGR04255 family protein n=1 Tax=Pseudoalteromonas piscicida TaxID=43662 RepID=UPI0030AEE79B
MPFESKPRVKFQKNPLIEVASELVFVSPVEDMEQGEKLVSLHTKIKDKLPLFKKAKSVALHVDTKDQSVSQVESVLYEFASLDETVKVFIEPEKLTFLTSDYQSKEEFFSYIDYVYEALRSLELTNPIKRVALRYKDVIRRSQLGNEFINTEWSELIRESLISIFKDNDLIENILGTQSNFTIKLNGIDRNAKMSAQYGVVEHNETKEQCFMIDSEFYTDGVFEYDTASKFLQEANIKARDFFQWCIKPKLYEALEPIDKE